MKKLKGEEIGYSISGSFLFAITVGALLESVFDPPKSELYASIVLAAIVFFIYMISMNVMEEE